MTDPTGSRSANQPHADDPEQVPASQPDADGTSGSTDEPDDPTAGNSAPAGDLGETDRPPVGAPEGTVPEAPAMPGTSESAEPVQGTHTPDVGPGGEQIDTDSHPMPGRTDGAR